MEAELSALMARLAELEQARGLPPQPMPSSVSVAETWYTRLDAYEQFHADLLQQIMLLEQAGTIPVSPTLPVEQPRDPAPDPVLEELMQPQPVVPPPQEPVPPTLGDPGPSGEQLGAPDTLAPPSHPIWVCPWGPWGQPAAPVRAVGPVGQLGGAS